MEFTAFVFMCLFCSSNFVSDFDEMMARKKEERQSSRRRKRNVDIINDSDDLIVDMLRRMKEAAEVSEEE